MRHTDRLLADEASAHWHGRRDASSQICALIADLDGFLAYLRDIELLPGYAIDRCPACAAEHRWALIKSLLIHALVLRPAASHPLLHAVDKSLDRVRELYGGEEGMRAMMQAASTYFDGVDSSRDKEQTGRKG
jgi:hypothetical protein